MAENSAEQVKPDQNDPGWTDVAHDTKTLDCIDRDHGACTWPENCDCPCHDVCTCAATDGRHDPEQCHVGLRTSPTPGGDS